jgi:NitT/TauT family transport system permease protein
MTTTEAPRTPVVSTAERPSTMLKWVRSHEKLLLGILGVVSVLAFWELAVQMGWMRSSQMSSPSGIYKKARLEFVTSGRIIEYLWVTMRAYLIGLGVATVVGIPIGFFGGWSKRFAWVLEPWLAALNATPKVAVVPLIILWLGIGQTSKVFIIFLFAVFPYAFNTMVGVRQSEAAYLDVARSFGASEWMIIRTIVLPGSVPFILTGARLAVGRALIGVVVAELIASNSGLGFLISIAAGTFDTALLMLCVLIIGTFGLIMALLATRVERIFDKWRPEPSQ